MADRFLEIMFLERIDIWENQIKKLKAKIDMKKHKEELTVLQEYLDPAVRAKLYLRFKDGTYKIGTPHEAQVPKDDGTMRTVYVYDMTLEQPDRLILGIMCEIIMDYCKGLIHKSCKSYQKGIGCGKVNQEATKEIIKLIKGSPNNVFGVKLDMQKMFDSVLLNKIDETISKWSSIMGQSVVFDIITECYHNLNIIDLDKNKIQKYTSLRQGCALASPLADMVLYEVDKAMSDMGVYYCRYSDDCLILGNSWQNAFKKFQILIAEYGLKLNPKKVEVLSKDKFFKFLGFSIRGDKISISKGRLETFKKEIQKRTVKKYLFSQNYNAALNAVHRYLYKGEYSWASSVLPIFNIEEDIDKMNAFVMDMLRAVKTGRYNKKFGIGYEPDKKVKGKGLRNGVVTYHPIGSAGTNRNEVETLDGYMSLGRMRKALLTSHQAYDTLVRCL